MEYDEKETEESSVLNAIIFIILIIGGLLTLNQLAVHSPNNADNMEKMINSIDTGNYSYVLINGMYFQKENGTWVKHNPKAPLKKIAVETVYFNDPQIWGDKNYCLEYYVETGVNLTTYRGN